MSAATLVAVVLGVGPGAPPARAEAPGADPGASDGPLSLTVRGGVSLGSYEAGLNWAGLRLFRAKGREMRTVTGASAGNINAFISALAWCQKPERAALETPAGNVFWRSWIPVGWKQLFPQDVVKGYGPDDGVFTRKELKEREKEFLGALLDASRFEGRCELAVGVTVTRSEPETITIETDSSHGGGVGPASRGIPVKTQRFVVTFDATFIPGKGLGFRQRKDNDPQVGQYLRLPTDKDGFIAQEQLEQIIEASSAFPMAFSPRAIKVCADAECKQQPAQRFFDGGVFDNVPLGLAVSLSEPAARARAAAASSGGAGPAEIRPFEYLYLDPDNRRDWSPRISAAPAIKPDQGGRAPVGLKNTLQFLSNFFDVSQQYELQAAARYLYKGHDSRVPYPRLSSRYHPIVGSFVGHFGAFYGKPFRQYDFYVGAYDALMGEAIERCSRQAAPPRPSQGFATADVEIGRCMLDEIRIGHDLIGLQRPPQEAGDQSRLAASYVIRRLALNEAADRLVTLGGGTTEAARAALLTGREDLRQWLLDQRPRTAALDGHNQIPLLAVLLDTTLGENESQGFADQALRARNQRRDPGAITPFLKVFAAAAAAAKLPLEDYFTDVSEQELLDDPDQWFGTVNLDVVERISQIEELDDYVLGRRVSALAQMALHSEPQRPLTPWDLDPSSVPDRRFTVWRGLAHLLPVQISGDFVSAGWDIAWRPTFAPWAPGFSAAALVVPLSPLRWRRNTGEFFQYAGLGLLVPLPNVLVTGLEVIPARAQFKLQEGKSTWQNATVGFDVGAYLLAGKLRLSVGMDDYAGGDWKKLLNIKLGIADINGLLYWASRFAVREREPAE